jgi:hypothetical protein
MPERPALEVSLEKRIILIKRKRGVPTEGCSFKADGIVAAPANCFLVRIVPMTASLFFPELRSHHRQIVLRRPT